MSEPERPPAEPAPEPIRPEDEPRSAGIKSQVARALQRLEERADAGGRRSERALWYVLRLSIQLFRQWARDRCPQQAASLAFQTILSVVPALAVGLAALRATGSIDAESSFIQFLAHIYIPVAPDEISARLKGWSENVTFESLGLIGLITVVVLAFIMFNSLERVMNHIWRVERRRSMAQKFVVFYATATIGPALIGMGYYQAASAGLTAGVFGFLLSFATSFLALFLANYFIPATPVRAKPALLAALVTTVMFEAAKFGFHYYVAGYAQERYAGIYGAVASVPLFLIWIYWSWLMLLLGVEVAHAAQNIHLLERIERRGRLSFENEILRRVSGPVAARLMVAVSRAYLSGEKTLGRTALATRLDLDDDVLIRLTERLKEYDLLLEVEGEHSGFLPARPPNEITLAEVLGAFRADDAHDELQRGNSKLDRLLSAIDGETDRMARDTSLADLVERPAPTPLRRRRGTPAS